MDPFGEMADRLDSVDVHGVLMSAAVDAAGEIFEDISETVPSEISPHIVIDVHDDEVAVGVTDAASSAAFSHEYGSLSAAPAGQFAMAQRAFQQHASAKAAVELTRKVTGS